MQFQRHHGFETNGCTGRTLIRQRPNFKVLTRLKLGGIQIFAFKERHSEMDGIWFKTRGVLIFIRRGTVELGKIRVTM